MRKKRVEVLVEPAAGAREDVGAHKVADEGEGADHSLSKAAQDGGAAAGHSRSKEAIQMPMVRWNLIHYQ